MVLQVAKLVVRLWRVELRTEIDKKKSILCERWQWQWTVLVWVGVCLYVTERHQIPASFAHIWPFCRQRWVCFFFWTIKALFDGKFWSHCHLVTSFSRPHQNTYIYVSVSDVPFEMSPWNLGKNLHGQCFWTFFRVLRVQVKMPAGTNWSLFFSAWCWTLIGRQVSLLQSMYM